MEQQQKACVCLGTHGFQRQLTLLTGTNTQCWWILGFIAVLTQNAHTLKKHDSCSATSSSSWIRILPLQSMLVSPSEVIFYLEACKKIKMKTVADWSCRVLPFRSEQTAYPIGPLWPVLPTATELSQDSGLLTCSVQATTMTTCKRRKETASWILTEID